MKKSNGNNTHPRLKLARKQFNEAKKLAAENGLVLSSCCGVFYQIRNKAKHPRMWVVNLYPDIFRIWHHKRFAALPWIDLPEEWSLIDAVNAVILSSNTVKLIS